MAKVVDLTGQRFGRLTVLSRAENFVQPNGGVQTAWYARCDCGERKRFRAENLKNGRTKSCGCLNVEIVLQRCTKHGAAADMRNVPPEYSAWMAMKRRCDWKPGRFYRHYGGRGISVCPAWQNDYAQFLSDVGKRPSPQHSLDRINNDGNYEPGNVRWATRSQQNSNRRPFRIRRKAHVTRLSGL